MILHYINLDSVCSLKVFGEILRQRWACSSACRNCPMLLEPPWVNGVLCNERVLPLTCSSNLRCENATEWQVPSLCRATSDPINLCEVFFCVFSSLRNFICLFWILWSSLSCPPGHWQGGREEQRRPEGAESKKCQWMAKEVLATEAYLASSAIEISDQQSWLRASCSWQASSMTSARCLPSVTSSHVSGKNF